MAQNFNFRAFGTATLDLRKTFAQLIKELREEELESPSSLESFVACRLIPLDKKPGLRLIGIGEVLRRIAGKGVMMLFKNDMTCAASALQLSAGQDAGVEAVVHAKHIFSEQNTEAVLLINAENVFSSINRKIMLHNMKFLSTLYFAIDIKNLQRSHKRKSYRIVNSLLKEKKLKINRCK